jgi:hypothetical protein
VKISLNVQERTAFNANSSACDAASSLCNLNDSEVVNIMHSDVCGASSYSSCPAIAIAN